MSEPSTVVHISRPSTWEATLCEFKGSPVYIVSFRTVERLCLANKQKQSGMLVPPMNLPSFPLLVL